jgi:hypothetical protein
MSDGLPVGPGWVVVPSAGAADESWLAAGGVPESVLLAGGVPESVDDDAGGMGASCADEGATPAALITQKAIERTK